MKEELLQVRIDNETLLQLEKLAKAADRSKSWYVRWLIKREYANPQPVIPISAPATEEQPVNAAG